jgi:hypothetical protein
MTAQGAGFLGILMLDTRFPRPPGDVGNPLTFARAGIPVRYAVVAGALPRCIVEAADPAWLSPFVDAARELVAQGAQLISTSCGFLAAWQAALTAAVPVPVISSSLLQCAHLARPGIVTISAAALDPAILAAAGVPSGTPVEGVAAGCEFQRRILGNEAEMDLDQAERDVVAAACALVARVPAVESLVLECTNMPPYRAAVQRATGRRVFDIETCLVAAWWRRGAPVG